MLKLYGFKQDSHTRQKIHNEAVSLVKKLTNSISVENDMDGEGSNTTNKTFLLCIK